MIFFVCVIIIRKQCIGKFRTLSLPVTLILWPVTTLFSFCEKNPSSIFSTSSAKIFCSNSILQLRRSNLRFAVRNPLLSSAVCALSNSRTPQSVFSMCAQNFVLLICHSPSNRTASHIKSEIIFPFHLFFPPFSTFYLNFTIYFDFLHLFLSYFQQFYFLVLAVPTVLNHNHVSFLILDNKKLLSMKTTVFVPHCGPSNDGVFR